MAYVLLLIIIGLVAWLSVPFLVVKIYIQLGGTGDYVTYYPQGFLDALTIVYFLIVPGALFGTLVNGFLGYWLAQSNTKTAKTRLYLIIAFALIGIPAIATYLFLRIC